jgi:hypothetical protein
MSQEEARARHLSSWLAEKARSIEAHRQRLRREQEEAQRQQEEDERQRAYRDSLRRQYIKEEVSRKLEKERLDQEQLENTMKIFTGKLNAAAAVAQQKQFQFLYSYGRAPAELDSQSDNFAKYYAGQLANIVKDPEMQERLLSKAGELMREKFKKNIEEKLKMQASESGILYFSPF